MKRLGLALTLLLVMPRVVLAAGDATLTSSSPGEPSGAPLPEARALGAPPPPSPARGAAPAPDLDDSRSASGAVGHGAETTAAPEFVEAAPASAGWVALRVSGAFAAVGLLLALALAGYRWVMEAAAAPGSGRRPGRRSRGRQSWFVRFLGPAVPEADRVRIVARSYLGSRESICVVEAGQERFLVGVTAARISPLGRLAARPPGAVPVAVPDAPGRAPSDEGARQAPSRSFSVTGRESAGAPPAAEPHATDFARHLAAASASGLDARETAIRTALARTRERLDRLSHTGARGD